MIEHAVWSGDCRELIKNIDEPVNCVVTDPPYGKNFVSRRAITPHGKSLEREIAGDETLEGAVSLFNETMDLLLPKCSDPAELYVFTSYDIIDTWLPVIRDLKRHGFAYKMLIVWEKGVPGQGDIDACWGCGHELIMYCKRGRRDVPYRRSGIIAVDKVANMHHIHSSEKPVALLEKLIEMSTDPGDLVVDPFSGSGSTVLAARNLGRRGLGIELDEKYVESSRRRLEQKVFG